METRCKRNLCLIGQFVTFFPQVNKKVGKVGSDLVSGTQNVMWICLQDLITVLSQLTITNNDNFPVYSSSSLFNLFVICFCCLLIRWVFFSRQNVYLLLHSNSRSKTCFSQNKDNIIYTAYYNLSLVCIYSTNRKKIPGGARQAIR